MIFVKTTYDIWLNVAHIVSVQQAGDQCEISLVDGSCWWSVESASEFVSRARAAATSPAPCVG